MNGPEASPAPPADAPLPTGTRDLEILDLHRSIASLRFQFHLTLAALVLVLAAFNVFLFHQVRILRNQALEIYRNTVEMQRVVNDYETNSVPLMERFTVDLRRWAEKDPQFAPVLARYALPNPAARPTNAPVAPPTDSPRR